MNQVFLKGNLTRDPELRYLANGTAVANFAIAVNRKWKDANGEVKEEVSFFDVDCWARGAEVVAQYFKKGNPILVQGRLKQESWDDKQTGQKRSKIKVVMESFEFCGGKNEGGRPAPRGEEAQPGAPEEAAATTGEGDDVPF
jgi:single-strand DNA-binding protein